MKLVLFQSGGNGEALPGLLTERGVVSIASAVTGSYTPQLTMQGIIDDYDRLKPGLEKLAAEGKAVPLADVQLGPPLPRPGNQRFPPARCRDSLPTHSPEHCSMQVQDNH